MKSTIFSASLFAALASAAPLSQGTVTIKLELDAQGLSATTFPIAFNALFDASGSAGFALSVNGASGIPIPSSPVVCQAFTDAAGTILLGKSFDETIFGVSISTTETAAQIGSIFCSDAAGVQARINPAPKARPVPQAAPAKASVRVQLNFEDEGAVQGEVPADNSIALIATGTASSAFIVSATGVNANKVSCQAWKDEKATQKLGKPFSGSQEVSFSSNGVPVPIAALKCKVI